MTTPPFTDQEVAYLLYLKLELGLITHEEVIQWSDDYLEHHDEPDIRIIELSLAKASEPDLVKERLIEFSELNQSHCFWPHLLCIFQKKLMNQQIQISDLTRLLYRFFHFHAGHDHPDTLYYTFMGFEDSLCLIEQGLYLENNIRYTLQDLQRDVLKFINDYVETQV